MLVYGTCLHTDISGYTAIARRVEPVTLSRMMDDYYRTIGLPVTRWGGNVCDTTGDSMLAVWAASEPDSHLRSRACHGALDIIGLSPACRGGSTMCATPILGDCIDIYWLHSG